MSIHWGGRGAGHVSRWSASTTGVPALVLDFLTTTSLDSRITFTRGTTATFVGSNGLIQTAAINAPRFDYDPVTLAPKGLLIEEARTNIVLRSEDVTVSPWLTSFINTRTANTSVSPTGATTADTITEDFSSNRHIVYQQLSIGSAGVYTFSMFLKQGTGRYAQVQLAATGGSYGVVVDLTNGAVTSTFAGVGTTNQSSSVVDYGNGWYRISVSCQVGVGLAYPTFAGSDSATPTYAASGNPTYLGAGRNWLFWGAQLEAGSFATSFIPTVASTVTRNAEEATMTGTNFSSWYNQTQGTFVSKASTFKPTTTAAVGIVLQPQNGSSSFIDTIYNSANIQSRVFNAGVSQATISTSYTANVTDNVAVAYEANNFAAARNGALTGTDLSGTVPSGLDRMGIGGSATPGTGLFPLNGYIRSIAYYNTRLLNTQLQTLTQ